MDIVVAHDFSCGWCYIGLQQVKQMLTEFPVRFEWRSFELYPEPMPFDSPSAPAEKPNPDRPKTPSRFSLALAAQGMELPRITRPSDIRTRNAHLAALYAASKGDPLPYIERIYRAYWEEGMDINNLETLVELGASFGFSTSELRTSIETGEFAHHITPFDLEAYQAGVYNLPTFWIGGERYAEQPITVLRKAIQACL